MKVRFVVFLTFLFTISIIQISVFGQNTTNQTVSIYVDVEKIVGRMNPVWAWLGYDEPNYTYMKDGQKLLTEFSQASPVPVYVRTHNLLTSGDGTPALKWGSTNVYTEDQNGNPVYDWTIIDRIFDTYIERGMKPLVEIGFMPKALSQKPEPYRHSWKPGAPYEEVFTGWAYPPKDYGKWAELVYQWVHHSVVRYTQAEVETWLWELWNEPNIGYWRGTTEEYLKLYDFTADAVKRALPAAKVGGPHVTGPNWDVSEKFLRQFLDHCLNGINYCTGETGSPLDYIGFHAKGSPKIVDGHIQMNLGTQLRDISKGFEIVAEYSELKHLPIIIGESDPEGCAACSMKEHPENAYRNGTMYSSYTAAAFSRKYALADHFGVNFKGAVTWAFEFENQPWFNGYRDLATNGVDKPVLNIFRMFGMMSGNRVKVGGDFAYDFTAVRDGSVRGAKPDVGALAATDDGTTTVMMWHYHDDNIPGPVAPVEVTVSGLDAQRVLVHHYRVDRDHSNSYEVWKKMGSPQSPTPQQYAELENAGQLMLFTSPEWITPHSGTVLLQFELPRQGVSLLKLAQYEYESF
ncbi:beta-xylosidase [candidate division KSB1 bacterium]|nr:beta-xylosidase [candidate division KSB1 bacterium]